MLFTLVMAWFLSLAMEPAVARLSGRMPRCAATALVMVAPERCSESAVRGGVRQPLRRAGGCSCWQNLPSIIEVTLDWLQPPAGHRLRGVPDLLDAIRLTPEEAAGYAQNVLGGVLGLIGSVAGGIFSFFAILLFTFYLSADGPRLRLWLAGMLPRHPQRLFLSVWDLSLVKTGGYVAARLVLATSTGRPPRWCS